VSRGEGGQAGRDGNCVGLAPVTARLRRGRGRAAARLARGGRRTAGALRGPPPRSRWAAVGSPS